jgi:hypothetical protein
VGALIEDERNGKLQQPEGPEGGEGVMPMLRARGVAVVDGEGWRRIDAAERAAGAAAGKPREKIVDLEEMLRVAATASAAAPAAVATAAAAAVAA